METSPQGINPNDEIRDKILRYFYDRNAHATSKFGKKGSGVRISDVKRELKELYGLTQQQVVSNLNYLLDREWVKPIDQKKEVNTKRGTTVPSVVTFYEISAQGIERIEERSEFQPREPYAGINIEATGNNVITLGDGNVVSVEYEQLVTDLSDLRTQIIASTEPSEAQKYSAAVDIQTLSAQLAKAKPDRAVVSRLWAGIEKVANVAGLAGVAMQIGQAIGRVA